MFLLKRSIDSWQKAGEQEARKERDISSMLSFCAEVRGFPPCKFSLYPQFFDMVALLQSLIQNLEDCHEVNESCSSSVLLQINSEAGP